jgi:hypothetical protein
VAKGGIELTVVAAAAASAGSRCLVIHFVEVGVKTFGLSGRVRAMCDNAP